MVVIKLLQFMSFSYKMTSLKDVNEMLATVNEATTTNTLKSLTGWII